MKTQIVTNTPRKSLPYFYLIKISLIVLIVSIVAYYVKNQQQLFPNKNILSLSKVLNKTTDFLIETWSTLSLSTQMIYNKLLTTKPCINKILNQLLEEENKVLVRKSSRIALGLGLCTDLVVEAIHVLGKFESPKVPKPHDTIDDWDKFLELFAYYFQQGAASERYIKSKQVFNKLIELIDEEKIQKREMIGSNAPLMSLSFAKEGIENILLGAQITKKLSAKFPNNIQISGPMIDQDNYHVILEYKTNQRWGEYQSLRANRLIVHSDDNNVKLLSRSQFFKQLVQFRPDLLIITGIHILDNSPIDFYIRSQAIESLAEDLEQLYHKNLAMRTHFEMASYTENCLLDLVVNQIFPHMESFGMNEQEVANLLSFIKFGNISYASNPFPRVAVVLDEMRELFSLLHIIAKGRVSRIHVHTLAYQVIIVKIDSDSKKPSWSLNEAAMAKASLTAYRHTCDLKEVDLNRAKILLDDSFSTSISMKMARRINLDRATKCWEEDLSTTLFQNNKTNIRVKICLAIGIICTKVVQTVGAGDSVSAAGLVLQI